MRKDAACFTCDGAQRPQQLPPGTDNPNNIHERGYQARFSIGVWAEIVVDRRALAAS
jgi:hypothetical protein